MYEYPKNGPMDTLSVWFSRIAMWLPISIVAIMLLDIVYRYVLVSSTLWVNETALWLGGFIYLSSGLYVMQQRSHIRISIIYDMVPLWAKRIFDILSTFCVLFFAFWVVWGGAKTVMKTFFTWERLGTVFDPPIPATNKILIVVLLLLFSLQILSNLIRDWPLPAVFRKLYDIWVTGLVTVLSLYGIFVMIWGKGGESNIPHIWRYGISLGLVMVIGAVIFGLVRDFHITPKPFEEKQ